MTERMREFIYRYWSKYELGQAMLKSNNVSDSDLWFLIPNNVKRRHGFPATRTFGKNKSHIKKKRKRFILSFKLFDLISNIIDETLGKKFENQEFFSEFVEFKNVDIGDKNKFELTT